MQAEKKKVGSGDDCHGNPEIDKLRKEVQETKEINKKLRELLQVHSHAPSLTDDAQTFTKIIYNHSLKGFSL